MVGDDLEEHRGGAPLPAPPGPALPAPAALTEPAAQSFSSRLTLPVAIPELLPDEPPAAAVQDGRLIRHARYFILQLAEGHLTRHLLGQILGLVVRFDRSRYRAGGSMTYTPGLSTTLAAIWVLSGCATLEPRAKEGAPTHVNAAELSEGYALLYDLVSKEKRSNMVSSQLAGMNYAAHLARSLAVVETNPQRKQFLQRTGHKFSDLRGQVYKMLLTRYQH